MSVLVDPDRSFATLPLRSVRIFWNCSEFSGYALRASRKAEIRSGFSV
jgi:hypothetical protein